MSTREQGSATIPRLGVLMSYAFSAATVRFILDFVVPRQI